VLENGVLRGIFGRNRDDVTDLRKIHDEELYNLYSSEMLYY
jgi:hypothetical protein